MVALFTLPKVPFCCVVLIFIVLLYYEFDLLNNCFKRLLVFSDFFFVKCAHFIFNC